MRQNFVTQVLNAQNNNFNSISSAGSNVYYQTQTGFKHQPGFEQIILKFDQLYKQILLKDKKVNSLKDKNRQLK